ncbi:MAG TPA: ABC transporter ATP-binding protein [Clostridiales bacterium]|nr:ABC transporter ATP-binding protein [Clostridiales bacterium]
MNSILTLDNVHSQYGSSHILQGVTFDLKEKIIAIVGRNGMGKSTLVKVIMGLVPMTSGKIILKGKDISNFKPYKVASLGVGYVPQGRELFPSLSADEHFKIVMPKNDINKEWNINKIYDLFPNLKKQPNKSAANFSGGEQQMIAIGRALLLNPSLLIMDEPSEGLAPVMIKNLIEVCKRLMSEGIHILLVEQNINVATSLADELSVMVSGQIVQKVDSEKIMKDASLRSKLLGVGA